MQSVNEKKNKKEKILLSMMPYWTPLIMPQGIGMLKAYLQKYGYVVKNIDPNVEEQFKDVYQRYFDVLRTVVPKEKRGNFLNIGHDVLHNHMMAAIKYVDEERYRELVRILVNKTYYVDITPEKVIQLNELMKEFYDKLENYYLGWIEKEKPDVVGFSVLKGNVPASIFAARITKKKYPHIKVLMGGGTFSDFHSIGSPNFNALLEETKDCVDFIMVAGQGEKLFLKYLQGYFPESKRVATMNDIDESGIPFQDLTVADLSDFNSDQYPYLAATASASCPNRCSFCNSANFWGEYRKKDVKQVVDEMTTQYKKYGKQIFFMTDSLLNPIISDLSDEFIKREICLYYDCYFRVDEQSGDINNTLKWRRGGMYRARMGVESGSQKVLDLMSKGITVDQTRATISSLAYAGIKTTAYIVIGHPDETEEDFQMTLDLLEELKDDIWQAECNPFYYHYTGQFGGDKWAQYRELLYPESARDMLVFDTWTLDYYPNREIRYDRMHRFIKHCAKLGIPNPYSASELYKADERWKKLHKNAVPSIWEFENWGRYINEAKQVKQYHEAKSFFDIETDFQF